jgi:hypothetical protein
VHELVYEGIVVANLGPGTRASLKTRNLAKALAVLRFLDSGLPVSLYA